jgi:FdhD protein
MLAREVAVALSFNGSTQAVMMATPADLTDFAYGFALTEGIATLAEIQSVEVVDTGCGIDVQCWLEPQAEARLAARRRTMAGPVGCGLCGIDSIEQALREPVSVPHGTLRMTPVQIMAAVAALPQMQPLHDQTRSAHCAGIWSCGTLQTTREDVGRHNALDKLAGHVVRTGIDAAQTAVVLTSRVSIDMVQKVAALRCGILIAVSAPTADAVALAERAGITLIALARADGFEAYTHTDRIVTEPAHVGQPQ